MTEPEQSRSKAAEYFDNLAVQKNLKKRALRGFGATALSQFLLYCIQLAGVAVLARQLTPDEFGLYFMLAAFFGYFRLVARSLGLTAATIQQEEINHEQITALFWLNSVFGFALMLFFVALAPGIAWLYDEPRLIPVAIVMSMVYVMGGSSAQHRALLTRNMQFFRVAGNQISARLLGVVGGIIAAFHGWSYWALVVRQLVTDGAEAVGAWLLCRWRPGLPRRAAGVGGMVRFGAVLTGSLSIRQMVSRLDAVLLGWRWGPQSVAIYGRAQGLFIAPVRQMAQPMTNVVVSTLSRLRSEPSRYRRYYLQSISLIAFFGLPMSAILTVVGPDVVLLVLGQQWTSAGPILSVLSVALGVDLILFTTAWLHISLGRADRRFYWTVAGSIVSVGSLLIGLPYGAMGVAVSFAVSRYLLALAGIWYAGIPIQLTLSSVVSTVLRYFVAALGAGLFSWFFVYTWDYTSSIYHGLHITLRLLLGCALCGVTYLLFLVLVSGGTGPIRQVIDTLRQTVRSMRGKVARPRQHAGSEPDRAATTFGGA